MIVRIASGVFESLRAAASAVHPNECCGLITGKHGMIEAIVPARNVSPHPATSFEIDPGTLLKTHRDVRADQRQVLGHYHSHPNGSTEPSSRDAARATHNGQLSIIIAAGNITGWEVIAQQDPENPEFDAVHGRFVPVKLLGV